jgi:hypothetical protein
MRLTHCFSPRQSGLEQRRAFELGLISVEYVIKDKFTVANIRLQRLTAPTRRPKALGLHTHRLSPMIDDLPVLSSFRTEFSKCGTNPEISVGNLPSMRKHAHSPFWTAASRSAEKVNPTVQTSLHRRETTKATDYKSLTPFPTPPRINTLIYLPRQAQIGMDLGMRPNDGQAVFVCKDASRSATKSKSRFINRTGTTAAMAEMVRMPMALAIAASRRSLSCCAL